LHAGRVNEERMAWGHIGSGMSLAYDLCPTCFAKACKAIGLQPTTQERMQANDSMRGENLTLTHPSLRSPGRRAMGRHLQSVPIPTSTKLPRFETVDAVSDRLFAGDESRDHVRDAFASSIKQGSPTIELRALAASGELSVDEVEVLCMINLDPRTPEPPEFPEAG
jgi:hypothetical protein